MSFATRMASNDVQEKAIKKIEWWLEKIDKKVVGGTTIGKYQDTVILDLTYQGGEIYVHSNGFEDTDNGYPGVTVNDIPVNSFYEFKKAINNKED